MRAKRLELAQKPSFSPMHVMRMQLDELSKQMDDVKEKCGGRCIVCKDDQVATICVPCMHVAMCQECAKKTMKATGSKCPVCNEDVTNIARAYLADC